MNRNVNCRHYPHFLQQLVETTTKCRKITTKNDQITINNLTVEWEIFVPCVTAINE